MDKKNYSKVSTAKKASKAKKQEVVKEEVVEKVPEVVESVEPKTGIVNCDKLNVRSEPKKDSIVTLIISKGDVVKILEDSDKEFYKVIISNGTEGYCMKKFIDIK